MRMQLRASAPVSRIAAAAVGRIAAAVVALASGLGIASAQSPDTFVPVTDAMLERQRQPKR